MTDALGLGVFDKKTYLNYTHQLDQFPDTAKYPLLNKLTSMEGMLFPDTYAIPVNYNTVQIIDLMLDQMTKIVTDEKLATLAQQHKMTLYELITLASVVQPDASGPKQIPLIPGI